MPIVTLSNVSLEFVGPPLLDHVFLTIEPGERLALVGRNGAGKSTLLRVLAREQSVDEGEITFRQGVRVSRLTQDVPRTLAGRAEDIVRNGLTAPHTPDTEALIDRLFNRLELDRDLLFESLSTGLKRRVLFGRAMASSPDILLLDEPTNHLDIEAIITLEDILANIECSIVFVTHDRVFLRRLATRILDLDRGRLKSWACGFDDYMDRRKLEDHAEEKQRALFEKNLAAEELWVRRGTKAQRTRGEARFRRLEAMRSENAEYRRKLGSMKAEVQDAEKSGRKVIEAQNVCFAHSPGVPTIRDLNLTVMRGDRIGIIGPNGAGKTTLLRLLLGELEPDEGKVNLGTNLEIAYFDQTQAVLDDNSTVREAVADGNDIVELDTGTRHVISYLERFLFTSQQAKNPVKSLSGGERNRLLLARLFTRRFNLLVMDEPTNDLDFETLELLEDILLEFKGTLLLVSHDREFVNNVVTSTLVFEGRGYVKEYAGGYDDYQRCKKPSRQEVVRTKTIEPKAAVVDTKSRLKKLSFKEERELNSLTSRIAELEAEQKALQSRLADPTYYKKGADIAETNIRLEAVNRQLDAAFERWTLLEERRGP